MTDQLDDFVKELQDQIYEETRADYGEVAFARWLNPLYMGAIDYADGYGKVTGSCGDTMEVFLRFDGDQVKEASFRTDGCGSSAICGSFAAELARGRTPDQLTDITGEKILDILGGMPEADRHCAFLAAETLQEALHSYMTRMTGRK